MPCEETKLTPLHICCRNVMPDEVIIAVACTNPAAIALQDEDGDTPLHSACRYGASNAVLRTLIEQGYRMSEYGLKDEMVFSKADFYDGDLPIHSAISHDASEETVELLLNAYPQGILACNSHSQTPLHVACEYARYDLVDVIVHSHAAIDNVIHLLAAQNEFGENPVLLLWKRYLCACSHEKEDSFQILQCLHTLLNAPYRVNEKENRCHVTNIGYSSEDAYQLLLICIELGESIVPIEFVSFLIKDHEEIIYYTDNKGCMPLHIAAIKQNESSSSYSYVNQPFQEVHKVDENEGDVNESPILGFDQKYMDKKIFVLSTGQKPDTFLQQRYPQTQSDLMSYQILNILLSFPVVASIPDKEGHIPLHLAILSGMPWGVTLSNIFKAYPEGVNMLPKKIGMSPFMMAASVTHTSQKMQHLTTIYELLKCNPNMIKSYPEVVNQVSE